ncbi:Hypothetical predicted protein [Lecanosticta acicola]|uniref:Uncharacterized protein n=1 Tax=Lecanosticta acicola TaxID=111012 RepID=A0AAI9E763_9PEZI|nr:Hypothetical predicted protein [Lecanosticta acicola]
MVLYATGLVLPSRRESLRLPKGKDGTKKWFDAVFRAQRAQLKADNPRTKRHDEKKSISLLTSKVASTHKPKCDDQPVLDEEELNAGINEPVTNNIAWYLPFPYASIDTKGRNVFFLASENAEEEQKDSAELSEDHDAKASAPKQPARLQHMDEAEYALYLEGLGSKVLAKQAEHFERTGDGEIFKEGLMQTADGDDEFSSDEMLEGFVVVNSGVRL